MSGAPATLCVDFGTSFTSAALAVDGGSFLVGFAGLAKMPSAVLHDPDEGLVVGEIAINQLELYPERFERSPKRSIGTQSLVLGDEVVPTLDAVAAVLHRVGAIATAQAGTPIQRVVLTHPAMWDDAKTGVLVAAGRTAFGVNPDLLPEPVAAAHRFAHDHAMTKTVVVYDLGGGTFDTAVMRRSGPDFIVVGSPGGDEAIGGDDFDLLLGRHVIGTYDTEGLLAAVLERDDFDGRLAAEDLRRQCTLAKETLSTRTQARIRLPRLGSGGLISRDQLNELITGAVEATVAELARTLGQAGIDEAEDFQILLVGGASRLPLVADLLGRRFGHERLLAKDDPKAAVALGAAAWALSTTSESTAATGANRPTVDARVVAPPPTSHDVSLPRVITDPPRVPSPTMAAPPQALPPSAPSFGPPPNPRDAPVLSGVLDLQIVDGLAYAACADGAIRVIDVRSRAILHERRIAPIRAMHIGHRGSVLITSSGGAGHLHVLDPNLGLRSTTELGILSGNAQLFAAGLFVWAAVGTGARTVGEADGLPHGLLEDLSVFAVDLGTGAVSARVTAPRAWWFQNDGTGQRTTLDPNSQSSGLGAVIHGADETGELLHLPIGRVSGSRRGVVKRRFVEPVFDQWVLSVGPRGDAYANDANAWAHQLQSRPGLRPPLMNVQQLLPMDGGALAASTDGVRFVKGGDPSMLLPRPVAGVQRMTSAGSTAIVATLERLMPARSVDLTRISPSGGALPIAERLPFVPLGAFTGRTGWATSFHCADDGTTFMPMTDGGSTVVFRLLSNGRLEQHAVGTGWYEPVAVTHDSVWTLAEPRAPGGGYTERPPCQLLVKPR